MIILSLCRIRFFLEKPLEASCTFVTIKRKEFLKEVCYSKLTVFLHIWFFLFDLFSYFMNCKNILFFVSKVQEKIANHAECGCANLIDKVLEVNALNDFFSHFSLVLMYNIVQWCHLTTYRP